MPVIKSCTRCGSFRSIAERRWDPKLCQQCVRQRRERREFRESTSLSERYRFWLQPLAIAVAPAVNLIFVAFVAFCVDWGFKYQSIATGVFFNLLLVHGIVVAFSMALIAVGNARLATPDYRYTLGISALSAFVAILATPFFLREPSFGAILVTGLCLSFPGSIIVITPFAAVSYFIATFFKSGKRLLTAREFSAPATFRYTIATTADP